MPSVITIYIATTVLSLFVNNAAVVALMAPVVKTIANSQGLNLATLASALVYTIINHIDC